MSYYDILLAKQLSGGGGGDITVESLSVTANGTYSAPSGKAYSPVVANVPNSYTASDEGKVVSSGALVAQTSQSIDTNGTYDTTLINQMIVDVSGGGGGLEYESGVYQLSENVASGLIPFSNTHENPPDIACVMIDLSDTSMLNAGLMAGYSYSNMKKLANGYKQNNSLYCYGYCVYSCRQTGKTFVSSASPTINYQTGDAGDTYRGYWVSNNGLKLPPKTNYQWGVGSYKWFAMWLPTS